MLEKKQSLINAAIIILIPLVFIFAMFDFNPETREELAEKVIPLPTKNLKTRTSFNQVPLRTGWNIDQNGNYMCVNCQWSGTNLVKLSQKGNYRCPSCLWCPMDHNTGQGMNSAQTAAFGNNFNNPNGTFPGCPPGQRMNRAQAAAFRNNARYNFNNPNGSFLVCPQCDFSMRTQYSIRPNSVKCSVCTTMLLQASHLQNIAQPAATTGRRI